MGNGKFHVWKEDFAIVKARNISSKAFAIVQDKNEITLVAEESELDNENVITAENGVFSSYLLTLQTIYW